MREKQNPLNSIAFLQCTSRAERPCPSCIAEVNKRVLGHDFIDEELIETTAIAIANLNGNYVVNRLTPVELSFALRLLEDIIPHFLDKVREADVRDRLVKIKTQVAIRHNTGCCGGSCIYCDS